MYDRFPLRTRVTLICPLQWKARKVGHNKYKLSVSGYGFTGVLDGKVVASIHPNHEAEWEIDHHINHNAYTWVVKPLFT